MADEGDAQFLVPSSKAALADAIAELPAGNAGYFRAVLTAMLRHDIGVAIVPRGDAVAASHSGAASPVPFSSARTRPTLVILQDDVRGVSLGPRAFHAKSIKRLLGMVAEVTLIYGEPEEPDYAAAAWCPAIYRKHALIIETTKRHKKAWTDWACANRPDVRLLVATPGTWEPSAQPPKIPQMPPATHRRARKGPSGGQTCCDEEPPRRRTTSP